MRGDYTVAERRTIGVRELKAHASAVLREVSAGAEIIVTMHGRPVARIESIAAEDERVSLDGMGNTRGAFSDMPEIGWEEFQAAKKVWEPRPLGDD
jgi:prevent-host-death family protein